MGGIHYHTDFSTPKIDKMLTFAIADFTALLYDLVKSGKIKMEAVRGRMYFMARGDIVAKCPKCGVEVAAKKLGRWLGIQTKRVKDSNFT